MILNNLIQILLKPSGGFLWTLAVFSPHSFSVHFLHLTDFLGFQDTTLKLRLAVQLIHLLFGEASSPMVSVEEWLPFLMKENAVCHVTQKLDWKSHATGDGVMNPHFWFNMLSIYMEEIRREVQLSVKHRGGSVIWAAFQWSWGFFSELMQSLMQASDAGFWSIWKTSKW